MEPPWDGGTKVCSKNPGHMTKMATMPIYGKNVKKSSSPDPKGSMTLKLGMQHQVHKYYQVCSNDDTGLTLTYFTARSNLVPYAFVWEKDKQMDFSKTVAIYDLKVAADYRSDKKFILTSELCPPGAVCPLPWGYIHLLNLEEKKLYKIRLQRDFF